MKSFARNLLLISLFAQNSAWSDLSFEEMKVNNDTNIQNSILLEPANTVASNIDVNDVSILYPLPQNESELEYLLPLSESLSDGRVILSQALFSDIINHVTTDETVEDVGVLDHSGDISHLVYLPGAGVPLTLTARGNTISLAEYDRWKVVSVRFDYGFPSDAIPVEERFTQVRLILQPFTNLDNGGSAGDASIHLLFNLAKGDDPEAFAASRKVIAEGVAGIKQLSLTAGVDTTATPLGVHPGLEAQGLESQLTEDVNKAIVDLVSQGELVDIALMFAEDGNQPWIFLFGQNDNESYQPLAHEFNQQQVLFEEFNSVAQAGGVLATPFFNDGRPQAKDYWNAATRAYPGRPLNDEEKASILKIQDPHFGGNIPTHAHEEIHISCASCHSATSRQIQRRGEQIEIPTIQGITASNSPTMIPAPNTIQQTLYNTRNFGYFFERPTVALRTLYESVAVAKETNEILGGGVQGRQCRDLPEYLSCEYGSSLRGGSYTCLIWYCD